MAEKQGLRHWGLAQKDFIPEFITCGENQKAHWGESIDGKPMAVAGEKFTGGLAVHADGCMQLELDGKAETLSGQIGIDDECAGKRPNAAARMLVENAENQAVLWKSADIKPGKAALPFTVNIRGVKKLRLRWLSADDATAWLHLDLVNLDIAHKGAAPVLGNPNILVCSRNVVWEFQPFCGAGSNFQQLGMDVKGAKRLPAEPACGWRSYPLRGDYGKAASTLPPDLEILQADGTLNCVPAWQGYTARALDRGTTEHVFTFLDAFYKNTVELHIAVHADKDVFRSWTVIRNGGKKPVTLLSRDAASVYFPKNLGPATLRTFRGYWGAEGTFCEDAPVPYGTLDNTTCNIAHNTHGIFPGCFLSFGGAFKENSGKVFGAALACDRDRRFRVTRDCFDRVFFDAGADPKPYVLEAGKSYTSPEIVMTFSDKGIGQASRNFHRYMRENGGYRNPRQERPIVLNSWEGCVFDFDEKRIASLIKEAAGIGAEMFVLDDGWFAEAFPRNDDSNGLGDWETNRKKLPHGIDGVIKECKKNGLLFGLWFEPEMANSRSRLFQKHPDWMLSVPNRPLEYGRGGTQLMLDLSNPAVEKFVYNTVADYLKKYPGIRYVKWDHNMYGLNHGSRGVNANAVSEFYDAAFLRIAEKLTKNFPKVIFQLCASGGGRTDYGSLRYFEEFWASDYTTFVPRAKIQWADSFFFPPNMVASHISRGGEEFVPYKARVDMAMSGRLGVELVPSAIAASDRAIIKKGIKIYKTLRPLIHAGELFRGRSPHAGATSEFNYVLPDKSKAVFFLYRRDDKPLTEKVRICGLDPDARYKVEEQNPDANARFKTVVMTGRELEKTGLVIKHPKYYSSTVALLTRVK